MLSSVCYRNKFCFAEKQGGGKKGKEYMKEEEGQRKKPNKSPEQIKKTSSLSDKGSITVKLHTESFLRSTPKEVYEAYTVELPSLSSTTSLHPKVAMH